MERKKWRSSTRDRAGHAKKLTDDLDAVELAAAARGFSKTDDRVLTYELQPNALEVVDSLERQPSNIRLLSVSVNSSQIRATVKVPVAKLQLLHRILERYATKLDKRSNRPVSQDLVESIDAIRLATERDLWTDSVPFPSPNQPVWWEIWLSHDNQVEPQQTYERFRTLAEPMGLELRTRFVLFPDRLVTIGFGRFNDWVKQPLLLLHIAELRRAKELAAEYTRISRNFQSELVKNLEGRLTVPPQDAPAVCLLDTGVDWSHPLLKSALDPSDASAIRPDWGTHDHHSGRHGTTMAGVALYDSLTEALRSAHPVELVHRLESRPPDIPWREMSGFTGRAEWQHTQKRDCGGDREMPIQPVVADGWQSAV